MPETVHVTLMWSDPEAQYLGSGGETEEALTKAQLWKLLTKGRRDKSGVVTSVTIWTEVPPKP